MTKSSENDAMIVTYTFSVTKDNRELLSNINELICNNDAPKVSQLTIADHSENKSMSKSRGASLTDIKKIVKSVVADMGKECVNELLDAMDVDESTTINKRLSTMDESDYDTLLTELDTIAPKMTDEMDDDDELEDDDEPKTKKGKISHEAVKKALHAYSKDFSRNEAMEIMDDNGAKNMKDLKGLSQSQLKAILKACS